MAQHPALDVATYLAAIGLGNLEQTVFVGPVRPVSAAVPAGALFVLATGGRAPGRIHDLSEDRYPSVQVTIRAANYASGYARAQDVYSGLARARISGYWDCFMLQSEPVFVGQDENGNYRWAVNLEARYQWRPA